LRGHDPGAGGQVVSEVLDAAAAAAMSGDRALLISPLAGGAGPWLVDTSGGLIAGAAAIPFADLADAASDALAQGTGRIVEATAGDFFVEPVSPAPRLLVMGATPASEPLVAMAALAGYRVIVLDPRPAFADADRFPAAEDVITGRADDVLDRLVFDEQTFVTSLLHDARFEDPLLTLALRSPAPYIGAMGSRGTHADRLERLAAAGFGEDDLSRIHGPIGLDLGSTTPAEMAVAIVAEMIAVRRGRKSPGV